MQDGRPHPGLLLALTGVAASVDAISYLGLRKVFPANMTGNTVLLAVGLAERDYASAGRSAAALGGFVLGAAVGGATASGRGWNRQVLALLGAELAVLLAAALWWTSLDTGPSGDTRYALIAMFGLSMGAQSASVTSLGVGVSTTYITGTWTSVSGWIAGRLVPSARRTEHDNPLLQCAVLVCYFGVALASGYLFHFSGAVAIWISIAALGLACLGAMLVVGARRRTT